MTKILRIAGLGLIIWSLGLLWPELDLVLVLAIGVAAAALVGAIELLLLWREHRHQSHTNGGSRHPSRPVPVH
jgi:hypothetical protein